ncbi:hypothetical protein RUND412_001108 [Rhizina undulata]
MSSGAIEENDSITTTEVTPGKTIKWGPVVYSNDDTGRELGSSEYSGPDGQVASVYSDKEDTEDSVKVKKEPEDDLEGYYDIKVEWESIDEEEEEKEREFGDFKEENTAKASISTLDGRVSATKETVVEKEKIYADEDKLFKEDGEIAKTPEKRNSIELSGKAKSILGKLNFEHRARAKAAWRKPGRAVEEPDFCQITSAQEKEPPKTLKRESQNLLSSGEEKSDNFKAQSRWSSRNSINTYSHAWRKSVGKNLIKGWGYGEGNGLGPKGRGIMSVPHALPTKYVKRGFVYGQGKSAPMIPPNSSTPNPIMYHENSNKRRYREQEDNDGSFAKKQRPCIDEGVLASTNPPWEKRYYVVE